MQQQPQNPHDPNPRSAIGMLTLIAGLAVYALIAAAIGDLLAGTWAIVQILYYIVAGILWIFPARRLMRWTVQRAKN